MTTIKVEDKYGKNHSFEYTQNLRFADFMRVNKIDIAQINSASEWFNLCKAEWTKTVVANTKSGMLERATTRAVLKGKEFKFRRTVTYAPAHATGSVDEIEAVQQWREKKVEASAKAQALASEFLAEFEASAKAA